LLNTKIIAAGFIVKDKNYYNYLSGGLIVDGYESKNSPSAKLHYLAMQDCFEKEDKMFYNISYSGPIQMYINLNLHLIQRLKICQIIIHLFQTNGQHQFLEH
jgi:hypothetical protein